MPIAFEFQQGLFCILTNCQTYLATTIKKKFEPVWAGMLSLSAAKVYSSFPLNLFNRVCDISGLTKLNKH